MQMNTLTHRQLTPPCKYNRAWLMHSRSLDGADAFFLSITAMNTAFQFVVLHTNAHEQLQMTQEPSLQLLGHVPL